MVKTYIYIMGHFLYLIFNITHYIINNISQNYRFENIMQRLPHRKFFFLIKRNTTFNTVYICMQTMIICDASLSYRMQLAVVN